MATPTLAESVTSATAAVVAASEAYQAKEERVALRESAVVQAAGLAPNLNDTTEVARATARGIWVGSLTGTGDLAVATLGVVVPALLQGMRIGAVATISNTTTSPKLRVMNLGSTGGSTDFPIVKEDGSALAAGDIVVGRRYRFEVDGAGNVLISGNKFASDGSPGIPTNTLIYSTPGTYQWTCPPGVFRVRVTLWAGGGGGGGSAGTAGSIASAGGGGEYRRGVFTVVPGTVYTIIVGAGGTAGVNGSSPGSGGTGGASSFAALMTALGGGGGSAANGSIQTANGAPGTGGSGGSESFPGTGGGLGYQISGGYVLSQGGAAYLGGNYTFTITTAGASAGGPGNAPGGGAGGGSLSGPGGTGGAGRAVLEY